MEYHHIGPPLKNGDSLDEEPSYPEKDTDYAKEYEIHTSSLFLAK